MMTNRQRRLKKLEAQLTDSSGFAPHSPEWREYCMKEIGKRWASDDVGLCKSIPFEAVRYYLQNGPDCP